MYINILSCYFITQASSYLHCLSCRKKLSFKDSSFVLLRVVDLKDWGLKILRYKTNTESQLVHNIYININISMLLTENDKSHKFTLEVMLKWQYNFKLNKYNIIVSV